MSDLPDISQLSFLELKELEAVVRRRIGELREAEKQRIAANLRREAARFDLSLQEIIDTKERIVPPKYRNPKNPAEEWAGRGRKPKWVVAHLEAGGVLKDLEIASQP